MSRERDTRGPGDERDERDARRTGDPRDARDPRLPDDPVDAAAVADHDARVADAARKPHFGRWIAVVVAMGLAAVGFTAWQVSSLREEQARRACERIVRARDDSRAVWLYLVARDPSRRDDPDVVAFVEFLEERLPPLECSADNLPTPIEPQPEEP